VRVRHPGDPRLQGTHRRLDAARAPGGDGHESLRPFPGSRAGSSSPASSSRRRSPRAATGRSSW
jgi:hypothetical protein